MNIRSFPHHDSNDEEINKVGNFLVILGRNKEVASVEYCQPNLFP